MSSGDWVEGLFNNYVRFALHFTVSLKSKRPASWLSSSWPTVLISDFCQEIPLGWVTHVYFLV